VKPFIPAILEPVCYNMAEPAPAHDKSSKMKEPEWQKISGAFRLRNYGLP
jgi:hypothetical protein